MQGSNRNRTLVSCLQSAFLRFPMNAGAAPFEDGDSEELTEEARRLAQRVLEKARSRLAPLAAR